MDRSQRDRLASRGLIVPDSDGTDSVRVYLQYLPSMPEKSPDSRRKGLQERFERLIREQSHAQVRLDTDSLSEAGQVIEAVVPVDGYEELLHDLNKVDDISVDLVQTYDAT